MNYRRVMRISPLIKVTAPLAGVMLVLAGCGAEENAEPSRRGTVRDHRQRHPRTQDLGGGASRRDGHHLPKHLHQSRGRHRLPQGHDRRAHQQLFGGDRQPAGHPGSLRGAPRRRDRRRRAGHRAGGARPGRAAGLRRRRGRVPAVLRRRGGLGAGLRRPRGRARGRDRELSALDLRLRPHRAQA